MAGPGKWPPTRGWNSERDHYRQRCHTPSATAKPRLLILDSTAILSLTIVRQNARGQGA